MTVHHNNTQYAVIEQEWRADAQKVDPRLLMERNARADAGMHEQIIALAVRQSEALQKAEVMRWDAAPPGAPRRRRVDIPACKRFASARVKPVSCRGPIARERVQHRFLMIADEVHHGHAQERRAGRESFHDSSAGRTAVHVIADVNKKRS